LLLSRHFVDALQLHNGQDCAHKISWWWWYDGDLCLFIFHLFQQLLSLSQFVFFFLVKYFLVAWIFFFFLIAGLPTSQPTKRTRRLSRLDWRIEGKVGLSERSLPDGLTLPFRTVSSVTLLRRFFYLFFYLVASWLNSI